ncbi:MAG: GGDEF domain-containing protein [Lachnospiraceae bacterium]|nr:GGDEF domain-containing protein [Lachnospiraceae bacterium]
MIKRDFLEENINRSSSLITSFTRLFISMLIFLGIVTGISAVKEVQSEVYTCLDEKFSIVLYSTSQIVTERKEITNPKIDGIIENYKIGKQGFCAILDAKDLDNIKVEFITKDALTTSKKLEKVINNSATFVSDIKNAYMPAGFMDVAYPNKQIDIKVSGINYRARIAPSSIKNVYILVAAGHDLYFYKIVRIVWNAIFLTLIAVPITIIITKKAFKILASQIKTLEVSVARLQDENFEIGTSDNDLYYSKNEIGHLATSIKNLAVSLDTKSKIDELTQVYNRRKFNEKMRTLQDAYNKEAPVSILFIDIDHFKRYNDCHGHVAGDITLKKVAGVLFETTKEKENYNVFRYGGEEFALICEECDKKASIQVAKDIAHNIKEANIEHRDSPVADRVTLSVGIATGMLKDITMDDILMNSDRAVYNSKETGRNKYTHSSEL